MATVTRSALLDVPIGTGATGTRVESDSMGSIEVPAEHIASAIAHKADEEGTTLRAAALALGVSAADYDRIVDPAKMVGRPRRDLGLET
jgi:fumarate hydratase class II